MYNCYLIYKDYNPYKNLILAIFIIMGACISPIKIENNLFWNNGKGQVHRDHDLPAAIYTDGEMRWYQNGKLSRGNDLPSRILANGSLIWTLNGVYYRENDKPAVTLINGTSLWYKNGLMHRDGDKPAVVLANGTNKWYRNGLLHRGSYLPAIEYLDGSCEWWKYGRVISLKRLTKCYKIIGRFGRRSLLIVRLKKYKRVSKIHTELTLLPSKGSFLGGQRYLDLLEKYY